MFKLIQKTNPKQYFETKKEEFLVGKSKKCEIVIVDPHISDVQAKVGTKNNKYFIKNLGQAPISVNGHETGGQFLNNGDEIGLGKTKFLIELSKKGQQISNEGSMEAKTMVLDSPSEETLGPRLVCTTSSGKSRIIPLKMEKLIIGRSNEATLKLIHPSISRKHCVIEKHKYGYVARNISTTNPLYLNEHNITEKRLFSGDQLRLGTFALTFISDEKSDTRQATQKIITKKVRSTRGVWLAAMLIIIFSGYLLYVHAYTPWQVRKKLDTVASQIELGEYQPARDTLVFLLHTNLSPESAQNAKDLLAQITLAITQDKAQNGTIEKAKKYLKSYLAEHGSGKEAEPLWDRLDYYRLSLGEHLESLKKHQSALREYSAIREDSLYFEEAQKAIRRIWLAYQQKNLQRQSVAQLLKEAETHFLARRYLTPVNKNAYAAYQAVLAVKPDHARALQRIEQIKTFYREHGEGYFAKGNWSKALSYFERYTIIDPESADIKKKISTCRQKLVAASKRDRNSDSTVAANQKQNEKREEIQRLLEESGTESSRIMKYLFEEQEGEKKSDTPW
jgi:pSer/pThr/pTyr-binding forkhead associated (FHA) protein